jgi:integrase
MSDRSVWDHFAPNTRKAWTRELLFAAHPSALGNVPIDEIRPSIVQRFMNALHDRPGKQYVCLTALRQLEKYAVVLDLLPRQITLGVKIRKSNDGHKPWTEEQVAIALRRCPQHVARLVRLAVETGQRGGDLIRMCWTDLERKSGRLGINVVKTQKTKRRLWIPLTREFEAELLSWRDARRVIPLGEPDYILHKPDGRPFERNDITGLWTYQRENNPHLEKLGDLVLHGLRASAIVRLQQAGANTRQISEMIGLSEPMVARYTRHSEQDENALAAVNFLDEHRKNTSAP